MKIDYLNGLANAFSGKLSVDIPRKKTRATRTVEKKSTHREILSVVVRYEA